MPRRSRKRQDAAAPVIRTIGLSDLHRALRLGWEDFKAVPSHAIILCMIYPVLGLVLARTVLGYSVLPLLFPLAAGFALLGPFAALGLYELSRRRERGEQASAWDAVDVLRSPSFGAMLGLGTLLLALFVVWVATAQAIYVAAFGYEAAAGIPDFAPRVLTTSQGWWLIVVGCGVGFLFAVVALCVSVVSFPLMLERHAGVGDAMVTSLRAVARNPGADGGMGIDRRGVAGRGIAAVLPRPRHRHPAARPCHLAPLSRGRRARAQSATATSPARIASGVRRRISRPTCSRGSARTIADAATRPAEHHSHQAAGYLLTGGLTCRRSLPDRLSRHQQCRLGVNLHHACCIRFAGEALFWPRLPEHFLPFKPNVRYSYYLAANDSISARVLRSALSVLAADPGS